MRHKRQSSLWMVILVAVGLSTASAMASDSNWTNAAGGVFNVSGNWSAGVPLPADAAFFDIPNTYTVTFITSPTNASANVTDGNVTFALFHQTYTLSSALNVGDTAAKTGRLTLVNGTVNTNFLTIGNS